jgi:putative oxidoreductase
MSLHRWLAPHTEKAFVLLRGVSGVLFAIHGAQKLFGVLGRQAASFGTQMWFGGLIEFVTGLLIALGLFSRCAAFLASGTMAVAYVQFHWKGALGARFIPTVNDGELALVYCCLFLYIACRGPGPYSVNQRG